MLRDQRHFFADGTWMASESVERIEVINPATSTLLGSIPKGAISDVNVAVLAANKAARSWAQTTVTERIDAIGRIRKALERRLAEAALIITDEIGSPIWFSEQYQAVGPVVFMEAVCELGAALPWADTVGSARVVYDPAGVVAAITPFCFPLYQLTVKVASALIAGCTVVLKPSEIAPFNAVLFAEAVSEAKLPPGVFNMLLGDGHHTGDALVRHPLVDMVSFTGRTETGRKVALAASMGGKKLTLGLSGRSASVLLRDADFSNAVRGALRHCWLGGGQFCASASRLIVPREFSSNILSELVALAKEWIVGDPYDPNTQIGPLATIQHRNHANAAIDAGVRSGARVLHGGAVAPQRLRHGAYVMPTILTDVSPQMSVGSEELFAPVLTVQCYGHEEEAIELANATSYGLSGAVWSNDISRAAIFAGQMNTGSVSINGTPTNVRAPFGGVRGSGYGRELGRAGIAEFLRPKVLQGVEPALNKGRKK